MKKKPIPTNRRDRDASLPRRLLTMSGADEKTRRGVSYVLSLLAHVLVFALIFVSADVMSKPQKPEKQFEIVELDFEDQGPAEPSETTAPDPEQLTDTGEDPNAMPSKEREGEVDREQVQKPARHQDKSDKTTSSPGRNATGRENEAKTLPEGHNPDTPVPKGDGSENAGGSGSGGTDSTDTGPDVPDPGPQKPPPPGGLAVRCCTKTQATSGATKTCSAGGHSYTCNCGSGACW